MDRRASFHGSESWPAGGPGGGGSGAPGTVIVVGAGLSGALFGMKLSRALPQARVLLVDPARRPGRGLAYGACGPQHLLNVPVSRMELGLEPSFAAWLAQRPERIADALAESGGDLAAAFAPRALFGDYLQERLGEALTTGPGPGLVALRGEAVAVLEAPRRGVRLADGREIEADALVLATGNMAPKPPGGPDGWFYDTPAFIPDPWAADALADLDPRAPILLLGAGLTMVDIALRLADAGHAGPLLAVSRRGLLPTAHKAGGAWPLFLDGHEPIAPLALLRRVRREVAAAQARGVPWQRVFDAMRPAAAAVWAGWTDGERRQFLRHIRPRWDIHRHRMAPRIAEALHRLIDTGRLKVQAARVAGYMVTAGSVDIDLAKRGGGRAAFRAARVINCTGPRSDFDRLGTPLIASLRARGLAAADPLGLGLESSDCALLDGAGRASGWLYALGPLTRPAWWEITAAPEIAVQVDRLVARISAGETAQPTPLRGAADAFLDLGAGI